MDFPRLWPAPASAGRDIFDRHTPAAPHREPAPACRGRLRRPARRRAASRRPGRAGRASRPRDSRDPVMRTGIIGGRLGYRLLRRLGARTQATASCTGSPYRDRSKVEALFGPGIWRELVGRIVIDFGCGTGGETIEVAQHGAKKVIGIDIRDTVLNIARDGARAVGVSDQCRFSTATDERADVILSIDGFEHYDDPEQVLRVMRRLLKDDAASSSPSGRRGFTRSVATCFPSFPGRICSSPNAPSSGGGRISKPTEPPGSRKSRAD